MEAKVALNCSSLNECIELAEFVINYRNVNSSLIKYDIKGSKLIIEILGQSIEVTKTKTAVFKAYREWKRIRSWKRKGVKVIILSDLMRTISKPFLSDALVEVLKILGYQATLSGDKLITNAPGKEVVELSTKLADSLEELIKLKPKASRSAKALITSLKILTDMDIKYLLNYLEQLKYIELKEHRVIIKKEWRDLLREIIRNLGGDFGEGRDTEDHR
jgi:hypothetical protein